MQFLHETPHVRVVFGAGSSAAAVEEADAIGARPILIVDEVASRTAAKIVDGLAGRAVGMIDRVRQHVPVEDADAARAVAATMEADALIALGGGSTIGLAKAVALTERIPILAIPTTYAGSEMTPVWGLTAAAKKTTGRDMAVAPRVVIYDPELTYSLPPYITGASGMNAIAHCVDALWARGRTPLTDVMAERAIADFAIGLPAACRAPRDLSARERCLVGAWLAGATFAVAGSSLHHKLCHLLGGAYNLPHAETHAVLLPWVLEVVGRALPDAAAIVARALGVGDAVEGLHMLASELGIPTSLRDIGLTHEQVAQLADEVDPDELASPIPLTSSGVRELLLAAAS